MAGERMIENSEPIAHVLKPDASAFKSGKDMASRKNGIASDATSPLPSLGDATSGHKGGLDQTSDAEHGVHHPPTSCYNYYYTGYNGTFNHLDDQGYLTMGGGSFRGIPTDFYYLPGYNPYNTGYIGADTESPYVSSGYFQQPVSYGFDSLQSQSWDSTYAGDNNKAANKTEDVKSTFGRNGSVNTSIKNSSKTTNFSTTVPLNSKAQKFTVSSDFLKSFAQGKPLKPLNRLDSGFHSMENIAGYYPTGKLSGFSNPNHRGVYTHFGPMNYPSHGRMWNGNQRFKSRSNFRREGEHEGLNELTRGPRTNSKSDHSKVSAEDEQPVLSVQRNKYNLEEFQSEYEAAKFFVIKSYSEDDIHKCVKYDVWSSTPNGNKKLDAAYRDAEAKASEAGTKFPIFLFFSVNGSGQFLGVAEMTGQVNFNKNMDFWQLDKWNGFFPVKWHIVKDLPNSLLRHIILENNENRPVTYSRDTQEVGLKQGLEILGIFKGYCAKTSLLDDFMFYEDREKLLRAKRSSKPALQNDVLKEDISDHLNGGERINEEESKMNGTDLMPSLVGLTKDLSINSLPLKTGV